MNEFDQYSFGFDEVIKADAEVPVRDWRLLRRLKIPDRFNNVRGQTVKRGLVLDVEATGLSLEKDDIIQLALLPFDYDPLDGRITDVHKEMSFEGCLLYTSPRPRDQRGSRMTSSA